jgi:hypothetical protein
MKLTVLTYMCWGGGVTQGQYDGACPKGTKTEQCCFCNSPLMSSYHQLLHPQTCVGRITLSVEVGRHVLTTCKIWAASLFLCHT